ncbi:MAG TPA: SusC/RagA family TonB-linked outer membrane protein, partial [Parasegetibacter sp.]
MKLLTLFLTVCCIQISAATMSQSVSLSVRNLPLESVFTEIKKQTGYSIIWDETQLETSRPVSIKVKNASLEQVFQELLANHPLTFELIGKMVVIKKATIFERHDIEKELGLPPITVSGVVVDELGLPLEGASIQIKGTKTGVTSGTDGRFKIQTNSRDTSIVLIITMLGYESRELTARNNQSLSIVMRKAETQLDEVVISTGVFDRQKENYTGAVTTFTAKELAMFGNRNLLVSLRNIDPSFNIIENNSFGSDPNVIPDVQIRGNSNIPNVNEIKEETRGGMNNPLVILDGFETTMQRLLDINQNEVESITILKDASATSIYGSRGANGVIVIKSRVPQTKGGRLQLSYRADITPEMPDLTSYNLMNAREKLELEYLVGLYNWSSRPDGDLDAKEYYYFLLGEVNRGVETDWLSQPLRTGWGHRHNITLEGGDRVFRYSASAQYNDIQGTMKGSNRRNVNGNITLMYNYGNIRFRNHLSVNVNNTAASPYGNFSDYARMNPYWAPYDENGFPYRFLGDPGRMIYSTRWQSLPGNPLYNATLNSFNKTNHTELSNNLSVVWTPISNMQVTMRFGLTRFDNESNKFLPADHTSFIAIDILRRGSYDYGVGKGFNYDGGLNLTYSRRINKHSFYGGLDYNILQKKNYNYSFKAEGFNHPNFTFLPLALQYEQNGKPSGSESLTRSVGLTTSLNYTYDNRYFIDLSGRSDGSSQFGALNRFAPFWSVGLGWNLHNEKFFSKNNNIDRLRIRGSIGTTGSQNFNAYQALQTYRYATGDRYFSWTGAQLIELGNENLR